MSIDRSAAPIAFIAFGLVVLMSSGCGKEPDAAAPASSGGGAPPSQTDHGRTDDSGGHHGHGGAVIELGEAALGSFVLRATRDKGDIVPGKDAPIDVIVAPTGPGSTAKVVAVRFWIGTEDAKGSVKALAEIEDPSEPTRWHTHAEIPNPLPAGGALWVQIEDEQGVTSAVSFDLRM
ncbi:MAG TPA: hypothetical protein DEB06_02930 [Phycisphaerales bacterium]|nr:hypothetical protein [Phycisphaerales bacterium]